MPCDTPECLSFSEVIMSERGSGDLQVGRARSAHLAGADEDAPLIYAAFGAPDRRRSKDDNSDFVQGKAVKHKPEGQRKQEKNTDESKRIDELLAKIEDTASEHFGAKLWDPDYRKVTKNGELGCAVSVSKILIESGAVGKMGVKESVASLDSALRDRGWKPLDKDEPVKAGYVVIGYNSDTNWKKGGGNAHVGIVSDLGLIWNNSSRAGLGWGEPRWIAEPQVIALRPWKYDRTYVLKPTGR